MYKLLLVSDREDVLSAFDQIHNWGYNGFRKPHVRRDPDGAKECLRNHHADGILIGLLPEQEKELMLWLRAEYPLVPVCEAGRTPEEALAYLGELNAQLNKIRADFSSDRFDEREMMIRSRRHLFRKLVSGQTMTQHELKRRMLLCRSRMDPNSPCILMTLDHDATEENQLMGLLQDRDHLLERRLFQSFGGDVGGFHVLPLVTKSGEVYVLAGSLREYAGESRTENLTAVLENCVKEGILHAEEYQGLHLRITGMEVLPSLYAMCSDFQG